LWYADHIIHLTQTGTTLRENHLKILTDGVIIESQACLIGNREALKQNPEYLNTLRILIEYIDAAQQGRGFFQLVANIRGATAEEIAKKVAANPITRGLQGPTISPIYTDDYSDHWFTVTIIVANANLLPAMEHIRAIGGSQTIVSPVRYIFLEKSPIFQQLLESL